MKSKLKLILNMDSKYSLKLHLNLCAYKRCKFMRQASWDERWFNRSATENFYSSPKVSIRGSFYILCSYLSHTFLENWDDDVGSLFLRPYWKMKVSFNMVQGWKKMLLKWSLYKKKFFIMFQTGVNDKFYSVVEVAVLLFLDVQKIELSG